MSSSEEAEFEGESEEEEGELEEEDDEDDVPLSNLKVNGKKAVHKEESDGSAEGDEDDEEDWEEGEAEKTSRPSRKRKPAPVDEESSEDDDDIPLVALASNKKPPKNGTKKPQATKAKKQKATKTVSKAKKKPTASAKKDSSNSKGNDAYQSASAALYGSESQKGLLIQRLLCRWWYSIAWPDPSSLPENPPTNYDSLDGFPGVYVCTQGDDVGKIHDVRDHDQCPNFRNFAKKSSEELQNLLLEALEKQKKELVQVDGKGTATENELNNLIKWAQKLKPSAADREAQKILKAAKLTELNLF